MPEDLALDSNYDVFINARGDLGTVSGHEAFEQEVMLRVVDKYTDLLGTLDRDSIIKFVELEAGRVVQEVEDLQGIDTLNAEFVDDEPNTVEVRIVYDTGDEFTFTTN